MALTSVNFDHLRNYLRLNYNVLFSGPHGIGKTAIVRSIFEGAGLRWKYFSASTLDPWVDFVGIPETRINEQGVRYLELIRPDFIMNDTVDAIFFDELNRAPPKVNNAIMELIQFKSINGHRLKNLRVIWGAINPEDDDDTYNVSHLDPAFIDRFQVFKEMKLELDEDYFQDKYPAVATQFIDWWKDLPDDQKKKVSPRRLDYAAEAYLENCRLEDFLPHTSGVKKLRKSLTTLPFIERMQAVKTVVEAEKFIKDVNNATKLLEMVRSKDSASIKFFEDYGPMLPKELCVPFIEAVYAHKHGMRVVASMDEMITLLPNSKGDQSTAALINEIDLSQLYTTTNNGSLESDLRNLNLQKNHQIKKLVSRIVDVILGCNVSVLERIFWGPGGLAAGKASNFQVIAKTLAKIQRELYSPAQLQSINRKVYQEDRPEYRIINDQRWL